MCKRMMTLGILVLIGLFIPAVYAPQQLSAAPRTAVGTIAYVVPQDQPGDEIWLAEPDGSNHRRIYVNNIPDPYAVHGISALAWRPDAGELVFASNYESACSWYASDLYAINADGSGYRRITNAPACAALANYPKGTVVIAVAGTDAFAQIYVQGAPELKAIPAGGGVVTFTNVADLGDVGQPIVIINGKYRFMTTGLVDVKAGQSVQADIGMVTTNGSSTLGAYRPTWRRDGSRIGYAMGCAELYGIADQPPAGKTGQPLFNSKQVTPCGMAWGPTASTANQLIYYTNMDNGRIYRVTEGSSDAGTLLIQNGWTDVNDMFKLQYLPDASGFLFSRPDNWGHSSNLYRYDFASGTVTRLTSYTNQFARDFSLSPDGQRIVYELAPDGVLCVWGCGSDLWMMGIDGSNKQLFKAHAAHPSWSLTTPYVPSVPTPPSGPTQPPGSTPPTGPAQPALKVYLPLVVR